MSYKIIRLEKSKSRDGRDEVFVEMRITDDLGTYPYGRWLDDDELEAFKKEVGEEGFMAAKSLGEFKFLNSDMPVLNSLLLEHIPKARKLKEDDLFEEQYQKAKKMAEITPPVTKEDLVKLKEEIVAVQRATLKEELRAEILKEIADGKIG